MFSGEQWFDYLSEGQKDLVRQAYILLGKEELNTAEFHDYSFMVFPMAKAYEGFLKKFFKDANLIDQRTYEGDRFRIGKSLNPALPHSHRGKWWLYGPLTQVCDGEELPKQLWKAWKQCRNLLFHFFPKHKNFVTFEDAGSKIEQIRQAMKAAVACGVLDNEGREQ